MGLGLLAVMEPPGRLLGSVALRYSFPWMGWHWPPPPAEVPWRGAAVETAEEAEPKSGHGPAGRTPRLGRLEAVLFLTQEPLGSRRIAQLASLADGTEARTLVAALNRLYDAEACAFRVVEVAGGFQLMTRPQFAPWLRRLHAAQVEVRLSPPAMETLAVVAYRQPVLRAEIEAIRGVQCGEILRQLMERDLVRIAGRSDDLGRPFLYGTTRRFLQVFGLRHLDELPEAQWSGQGGSDRESDAAGDAPPGVPESQLPSETPESLTTEEELIVKSRMEMNLVPEENLDEETAIALADERNLAIDDDEDDLDDEDEDDEDLDEDDEDWEEVPDEDEDEDEDWDDEEGDDWDDDEEDDDDWEEDDDDDWEDDDEEDWEEEE